VIGRFHNYTLRTLLGVALAAPLLLCLLVGGAAWVEQQHALAEIEAALTQDRRVADLVGDAYGTLRDARRNGREFLLQTRSVDAIGTSSDNASLFLENIRDIRTYIDAVQRSDEADDTWRQTQVPIVLSALARYEKNFLTVVESHELLGNVTTGLEGQFREKARAIEARVPREGHPLLLADLLSMRRHEKEFVLRKMPIAQLEFRAAADQFERDLDTPAIPRAEELRLLLTDYRLLFERYCAMAKAVEEASLPYLDAVRAADDELRKLLDHETTEAAETLLQFHSARSIGTSRVVLASLGSLLLGLLITAGIARRVSRSMRAGIGFARQLARGNWNARLPAESRNEIGTLSAALNDMADALQRSHELEQANGALAVRANRTLRVLLRCNYALVHATDEVELLQDVTRQIVDIGGHRLAWVGFAIDDDQHSIRRVACAGPAAEYLDAFALTWAEREHGLGPTGQAIRLGQVAVVHDIASSPAFAPWADRAAAYGLASCISLPLRCRDGTRGTLGIYAGERDAFDGDEIALLEELVQDMAYGVDALREAALRRRFESQLEYSTHFDAQTGLPNHALFSDRLGQALLVARRDNELVAVLDVAIDRLSLVAANLGAAAVDELIGELSRRLTASLRPSDTVARIGTDHFGVLLGGITEEGDVAIAVRTLMSALCRSCTLVNTDYRPSVCIGVSLFPRDGESAAGHLNNAAAAVAAAQAAGAGTSRFHAIEANERAAQRFSLEVDLAGAIAREEFVLHFQPKVSLDTGHITGAEALVRWRHPTRGLVLPGQFITVAEETGHIESLGAWIIDSVCEQIRIWHQMGLPDCPIAVNLSPRQFRDEGLVEHVERALATHAVSGDRLEVELTESAVMHDVDGAVRTLAALRRLGVRCALDDFGTGHSSLSHLKRFPIDCLKIDRSFVQDINSEPDSAAICNAVIDLAHHLQIRVVAEGVESEAQASCLRRRGCDEMQGHFFSPAVPADEFASLLRRREGLLFPPVNMAQRTLLVVDDEPNVRSALRRLLRGEGYEILLAESAQDGLELLAKHDVHVVLSDQRMPEMNGTDFLARVSSLYPDIVRIVLSGYTDVNTVIESVNRGTVFRFLTKPWIDQHLKDHMRVAFHYYDSTRKQSVRGPRARTES
jgi:diguanylate cyclase (GGDEF)-like protein